MELKNGASAVRTLGSWGVGLQWVWFSQETKLLKLAANSSTLERRAGKGIFNLSSDRYRQSVQHRPNSNTTGKQIPEKFNSVLLQNHDKANGCVASNGYRYIGNKFHDKFHRDHILLDNGNFQLWHLRCVFNTERLCITRLSNTTFIALKDN
jgi:hypothetical protein